MPRFTDALRGRRLFVELPDESLHDWVSACEVLIQERMSAWAFPLAHLDLLPEVRRMFGRRAAIGIRGVRTAEDVRQAREAGAAFATAPFATAELAAEGDGLPLAVGAMTPTEVNQAIAWGAQAVLLTDAMPVSYSAQIARLFPQAEVLGVGRLTRAEVEVALDSRLAAVGLAPATLFPDVNEQPYAAPAEDLSMLRVRCQMFGDLA